MTDLPRLKPDPLPAVHPLPEYAVEGQRAEWYAEMKAALQVPWMGVVTMAFAHYPNFFGELWRGLAPLVVSRPFVDEARGLQDMVETGIAELSPPAICDRLQSAGYGTREVSTIREINDVFSHGNHFYALIATIARTLLEDGEMTGTGEAPPYGERHAPEVAAPLVLMEGHHADAPTQAVYEDVKEVLGLPFVNTDYRAFARWPSYWAMAWGDLRRVAGNDAHEALCTAYHERMVDAVRSQLPNPGRLNAADLVAAAEKDATRAEILEVVRLFQWLLPGLGTNVAYLKLQLADS